MAVRHAVLGLNVAMDDVARVHVADGGDNLLQILERLQKCAREGNGK